MLLTVQTLVELVRSSGKLFHTAFGPFAIALQEFSYQLSREDLNNHALLCKDFSNSRPSALSLPSCNSFNRITRDLSSSVPLTSYNGFTEL